MRRAVITSSFSTLHTALPRPSHQFGAPEALHPPSLKKTPLPFRLLSLSLFISQPLLLLSVLCWIFLAQPPSLSLRTQCGSARAQERSVALDGVLSRGPQPGGSSPCLTTYKTEPGTVSAPPAHLIKPRSRTGVAAVAGHSHFHLTTFCEVLSHCCHSLYDSLAGPGSHLLSFSLTPLHLMLWGDVRVRS